MFQILFLDTTKFWGNCIPKCLPPGYEPEFTTANVSLLKQFEIATLQRIENAHEVRKKTSVFLCGCYMCNYWGDRTDTGYRVNRYDQST